MPTTRPDALTQALGAAPPATVAALPAQVRDRLAEQVLSARVEHERLVAEAVSTALRGVPLPVRGVIRKALQG